MGSGFGGTDFAFVFDPGTGVFTMLSDPLAAAAGPAGFFTASTGGTDAFGINDLGQVVGSYYDNSSPTRRRGFIYDPATGIYTTLINPADPGQIISPFGINNSGQIVGSYQSGSAGGGFIATPEQVSAAVPEPSSLALIGVFAGCAWLTRRRIETQA